ncbi:MAG TPA: YetF domain-containing protein [Afifellaceae bacterium]|nr:YetF domain-containing protein [Afifellaceae bacterium]
MLFDSWSELARVLIVGTLAYGGLVALLRVTGKRTLSKMNAFDFVVTVALGSTLATILLSRDTALADGMVALALLILLQLGVAWLSARSRGFRRLVKSEPRLLFAGGRMLQEALLDERVAPEEVWAAIRATGHADLDEVEAVVLETDGTFSVLARPAGEGRGAMASVRGWQG